MGNRIRALLKQAGKTQAELATAIGVTPGAVSRQCDGQTAPTGEIARKIARFLRVRVAELGLRGRRRTGPRSVDGRIDRAAIEKALGRLGLTAAELARRVGVTRQAISSFLAGRTMPRASTLRKIAQVVELDVSQIVTTEQ